MTATPPPSTLAPHRLAGGVIRVFGDLRFHADAEILALAFAADGSVWSVEEQGILRCWDAATGQQRDWRFLSELETLWAFNSTAQVLASASDDLVLWDVASGQQLLALEQPSWVTALSFLKDTFLLATGHDDGLVCLWDTDEQGLVREFWGNHEAISALAFSPDGSRLAIASEDRSVSIYDVARGRLQGTLKGHTDRIQALAWHPQGQRLVSAGWDTTARVWDPHRFEPIILLNSHASQVTALAFSPDGELLVSADSDALLHVWEFGSNRVRHFLEGHRDTIACLAFRADGQALVSGGGDRVIHLWDVRQGKASLGRSDFAPGVDLSGWRRNWTALAVHPEATQVASSHGPGLEVWDPTSADALFQVQTEAHLHSVTYSPDGCWIAGGGSDARVRLWAVEDGQLHNILEAEVLTEPVTALSFAPDSARLASAGATGTAIWIWDVASGEPMLLIPDALDGCTVESLAFHPQGRFLAAGGIDWLATGGSDGAVSVWDLEERCEIATFGGGSTALTFHPAGRWLASASLTRTVCVWDLEAQHLAMELIGHEDTVTCVAYSPDGRWLASGSDDRTVRLWDADTGLPVSFTDLNTQVKGLCFSPDGRYLFTGNGNTTCYQLEVQRLLTENADG